MTDVLLYQILDDGEVEIEDGVTTLTDGFETALYLALFGGNIDDSAGENTELSWWGNINEDESSQYRSQTQFLLRSIPATSRNIKRINDAVKADLKFMLDENIASDISVSTRIPERNKAQIDVVITADGDESSFSYTENWRSYT